MNNAPATIKKIMQALPFETIQALDAKSASFVSHRTIKINLKTPAPDGTNVIKVTLDGGKFTVRGYRVEETEMSYGLDSAQLPEAVFEMAQGTSKKSKEADAIAASVLKKAAGK